MLAGAGVRFIGLGGKIFGNDEATTSMHVSGHTLEAFARATFDGKTHTASDLLAYQRPDPAHGPRDVVASLAVEDPQHPPLYFLLERQWELAAGSSLAARRALSAIFGVLSIAAAVWLGIELWSLAAGLVAGALFAASPFAIAYAQVAREYSLWLALTFASTAFLIRALRTTSAASWVAYGLCVVAGLYTDTLFALVVVAHALALPFAAKRLHRATLVAFGIVCVAALVAYAPWLARLSAGFGRGLVTNNTYLAASLPLSLFALKWVFNIGTLFYDADYLAPKTAVFALPGIAVLIASAVACARAFSRRSSLALMFALALVTVLALVVPDLAHHGQRSTASRYCVPLWVAAYATLGVGLAIAFDSSKRVLRYGAFAFVVFTAVTGFGSFAVSRTRAAWWVDGSAAVVGPLALAVARADDPLVVWHATWGPSRRGADAWDFSVMLLADLVPPQTRFRIVPADDPVEIAPRSGTTFVLTPDARLVAELRARGDDPVEVASGTVASRDAQVQALQAAARSSRTGAARAASRDGDETLWRIAPK